MNAKKFTGQEGQLISARQAAEYTAPHLKKEVDFISRGENFVKAEFFGLEKFNNLMKLHGDSCVGFRVYYGVRDEDDNVDEKNISKKPTSRLVIVPVDCDGNDLLRQVHMGGMKDMPAQEQAMVGGPICPRSC